MSVKVQAPSGTERQAMALVNTGAQCNLIKQNFLPAHLMSKAKEPLVLLTADHSRMSRGKEGVTVHISFETGDEEQPVSTTDGTFVDAQINVDFILSYPWLREKKITIIPHMECLGVEDPRKLYLRSVGSTDTRRTRRKRTRLLTMEQQAQIAEVRAWNLTDPTEAGEPSEESLLDEEENPALCCE